MRVVGTTSAYEPGGRLIEHVNKGNRVVGADGLNEDREESVKK